MVKKVSSLLHKKNSIAGASIILIVTLTLSNLLGVVRDHFLTQKIPTDILSVYYAAFRIPDLIFNILILGAITSAFIPIFTNLVAKEKEDEAWGVAASIVNIAFIFLIILSVLLAIFMPLITPLVVPGFTAEKQSMTTDLARIMLFSPIFFGLSYIFGGILNSYKRFLVYSLSPLVYNLAIILGTILFADKFGIVAVSFSVIIGAFLHCLIQLPVAIRLGFRFQWKILWQHWGVKRIGILMIPRAIALGANQIMLLIFTGIASGLGGYSIAVYNLADNIQTMPMVVFGTSFATAVFPALAESVSRDHFDDFSKQIKKVTKTILFFMIPMVIMLIMLRAQIVRLILGSGHFGWEQTISTADTLALLAVSLVFTGLTPLFSRAFYALHNTRTPMIITLISVAISIVLGKILSTKYGVEGLALGYSTGSIIACLALYFSLRKPAKLDNEKELLWFIGKILIAGVIMAFALEELKYFVAKFVDMQRAWGVAVQAGISLAGGLSVYWLVTWLFGLDELKSLNIIIAKITKKDVLNEQR